MLSWRRSVATVKMYSGTQSILVDMRHTGTNMSVRECVLRIIVLSITVALRRDRTLLCSPRGDSVPFL